MKKTDREIVELINKADTYLDGIESCIRQIWPDEKPAPEKNTAEYDLYVLLTRAMVHIGDLSLDLMQAETIFTEEE